MITINFIAGDAQQIRAQGRIGRTLMEAAVAAGVKGIAADCGGLLTCATCHVMVAEPFAALLPAADGEERAMLAFTAMPATPASRLSCQIILNEKLDGLTVELPASQY
ncbi:2Fe-2S iron-sulfur cluster-binding protein [Polaromonas sp.]|uniref:2Fe-2S iron-sulfur cluster-binding protein n=1 Tax=Polaromonas sp. TaxID=1869339 RepID=UPI0037520583